MEQVALAAPAGGHDDLTTGRQVTAGWIAERLGMDSRGYLNPLLYRRSKSRQEYPFSRTPFREGCKPETK